MKQMLLWNCLALPMTLWLLEIWSLVPLPFLNLACTSGSSWFIYCWSLAWSILSITLQACELSAIVQWFEHSLVLPFFGIGMKMDLFQSCGHCWVFQQWRCIECSTTTTSSLRTWNSSAIDYNVLLLREFFRTNFILPLLHYLQYVVIICDNNIALSFLTISVQC